MLFRSLWRAALSVAAVAPFAALADDANNPTGQSTFISPDKTLAFAFTVPDNGNTDVYFSLRVAKSRSWGAVGLGSDEMAGALFLIVYQNERGNNVTFSPRLAYGNYEPKYYPDLQYEVFDGTGLDGDYMVFNTRCIQHCRSWPAGGTSKGYIDVSSPSQKALYALGPKEGFWDNHQDAPLKMHAEYGTFTIDMKRTQGRPDLPVLTNDSQDEGTTLDDSHTGVSDWKASVHAAFMVFSFIFLFPLGAVFIRIDKFAKFHRFNQTGALLLVVGGFALGILTSFHYQRSRDFNSVHQIIGFIVIFFLIVQFGLGVLHHLQWRRTKQPSIFSRIHTWNGRIAVTVGAANGFVGFGFAGDRKYGIIVIGIIFAIIIGVLVYSVWVNKGRQPRRQQGLGGFEGLNHGYQQQQQPQQPWRNQPYEGGAGAAPAYSNDPPPGYEVPTGGSSGDIGLRSVSPWRSSSPERRSPEDEPLHLESAPQKPREFA